MSNARRTAAISLAAALALGVTKLLVGLATGSLGILAEAVHSALDAVAAVLTVYAVGVSERPADERHQYGHGKAQHLAALSESLLLARPRSGSPTRRSIGCAARGQRCDATWYAFALLGGVLVVDAGRTMVSLREGRRSRNAALMASATHFGSDFAGTVAVLIGLALTAQGFPHADSWAALFVAALVLVAAGRLAAQNIDVLMDRAPTGLAVQVEQAAAAVPGVREVRSVRVREAAGESFAEVVIAVSRLEGLERSHETMDMVEQAVRQAIGPSQITVHVEPTVAAERANDRVAAAALRVPGVVETHNITVLEGPDGRSVTLHARVDERLTLARAMPVVERLKAEIPRSSASPRSTCTSSRWPPMRCLRSRWEAASGAGRAGAGGRRAVAGGAPRVVLYRQGPRMLVVATVSADQAMTVREAHNLESSVEDAVRGALDAVDDVIVEVSSTASPA